MKKIIFKFFFFIYLFIFCILIFLSQYVHFTRFGGRKLNSARSTQKVGVYPIRDHYYYPLFKDSRLKNH